MLVVPKRAILWVFVLAVVLVVVGGFSGEAAAQVFRGTLTFQGGFPFDVTLTLVPGGPAVYVVTAFGTPVDIGTVTASVAGSAVVGVVRSNFFLPCQFQGTFDGTTAILTLDPITCGRPGTVVLTRA